jgi:hypothetical protein
MHGQRHAPGFAHSLPEGVFTEDYWEKSREDVYELS